MSEPRYIQRDPATGEVIGHFSHPHPYAQEVVSEDHPDILAWRAKIAANKAAYLERKARTDPERLAAEIAELRAQLAALRAGR